MKSIQKKQNIKNTPFRLSLSIALIASLCACASSSKKETYDKPNFDTQMGSALTSPLSDLNLTRKEIPAVLIKAHKAPYALPVDANCNFLLSELSDLDAVLGPDLDVIEVDENGNVINKGADELGNAALSALRGFTEGVMPFRSWVRRLTGADAHAKEVAAAGMAGIIRRAYLKGMAATKPCVVPQKTIDEKGVIMPKAEESVK
jgi:hypothetical protein